MLPGCNNPSAANYNPLATQADNTCLYVKHVNGVCYLFKDIQDGVKENITASYSQIVGDWVFFHGYHPDHYIFTRNQLFTIKDNVFYKHNAGPRGVYYNPTEVQPFFVDLVVTEQKEGILSALQWLSEVLDPSGKDKEHLTFTHITIWNNYQCTGKITLDNAFSNLQYDTHRKTKGAWNYNDIRDIVVDNESPFLKTIFEDYAVDLTKINVNLPWYRKQLLQDDHFIVRLEYDNTADQDILLHQLGASLDKTL
jgi:hypothetical protein